ncbi:MAG TPA: non-canonical purine NTP pyrophosphatase [Kofleriaceae bacterium]
MPVVFIDGNDFLAAAFRGVAPQLEVLVEHLQTGFATSAPEPGQKARDKVLAHQTPHPCFAEAVDLTTVEGKSLRLELDSENANRFCKWWRETPTKMELRIAVHRPGPKMADVTIISATCNGRIADQPRGPLLLGWDRLFVPDGYDGTLAELTAAGELVDFRRTAYEAVVKALG